MASVQAPSATQTFLATPEDAILLMEAARQGLIPRTTRRLTRTERADLINDGSVFVFEEQETQMQRWTDGRRWSCSRVMAEFLAYDEVVPCGVPSGRRSGGGGPTCRLENGLIKQSFALTFPDGSPVPKKYHIVSYSRSLTMHQWKRPSQMPQFAALDISAWHAWPTGTGSTLAGSSKPTASRASSAAGKIVAAKQKAAAAGQSLSFTFHPNAIASSSASSSAPSTVLSGQSPRAVPSLPERCCSPKVEGSSQRTGPSAPPTRSVSPVARRSPSLLRARTRPSSPVPLAQRSLYDRHRQPIPRTAYDTSSEAAASLLGLTSGPGGSSGMAVKREPQTTTVSMSAPASPRRSGSPSVHPYRQQQQQQHWQQQPYQQTRPHVVGSSLPVGAGGSANHHLPNPAYPYSTLAQSTAAAVPPPILRPPWAASTLGQEDKRMLGQLPFRI